jgi:hypothetical protein
MRVEKFFVRFPPYPTLYVQFNERRDRPIPILGPNWNPGPFGDQASQRAKAHDEFLEQRRPGTVIGRAIG